MKWDECKGTQGEERMYKFCSKGRESKVNSKRDLVADLFLIYFKVFSEWDFKTIDRNQGHIE